MKIYAHLSQQHKNKLRKGIWNKILDVANINDLEERKILSYYDENDDSSDEQNQNEKEEEEEEQSQ